MKNLISASILSADFARLGEEAKSVLKSGADLIHFDVMDNHYVPNLTIGPLVCKSLRDYGITQPIDVHLMVKPVDDLIQKFTQEKIDYLTFHPEASNHIERSLSLAKRSGCKVGLAFNPTTSLNYLDYVLDKIDIILIMSVNPGFAAQEFIPSSLDKIRKAREIIDSSGRDIRLEVDGGIKVDNIRKVAEAGADTFVMGSALFNTDNYAQTIKNIHQQLK
ncbi:ribulose-phosphate 3-epimerase [Candidatus Margulisiibacteriota bacterium]